MARGNSSPHPSNWTVNGAMCEQADNHQGSHALDQAHVKNSHHTMTQAAGDPAKVSRCHRSARIMGTTNAEEPLPATRPRGHSRAAYVVGSVVLNIGQGVPCRGRRSVSQPSV